MQTASAPSVDKQRFFQRSLLMGSTLAAVLLFIPFWVSTKFPYLVDEYFFLSRASRPGGIHLSEFSSYIPLRPWFALINFAVFKSGMIAYPKIWILVYFMIHALSFGLLFEYFLKATQTQLPSRGVWIAATVPMILFPSNYELHLMVLNLPYTLGLLSLSLGFRSNSRLIQGISLWVAFLALETYVLPGAALLGLPATWIFLKTGNFKIWLRELTAPLLTFLLAYFMFFGTTRALVSITGYGLGDRSDLLHVSVEQLFTRLKLMTGFIWHLHFYKAYWLATVIQWVVLLLLVWHAVRSGFLSAAQAVFLFLLPFLASLHYLIVPYYAPRAVYGGIEMKNLVVSFLLLSWIQSHSHRTRWVSPIILTACHLFVLGIICSTKTQNFHALAETEEEFAQKLKSCGARCEITMRPPNTGLKRDWMMLPEYYEAYFEWVAARRVPGKSYFVRTAEETPKL